ncbi:hypothetical protein CI109_104330 [Kwoniella shandongensis]|uniref:Uncharacterized protein n=1 Tax=Kwoniella shandongensis TaxID=1734106 RepID=A0A5M6BX37_9TREE|nr:uncharacterized protein CI109_004274 [Kwoniella shandongensis]KAA5527456.1 hypothetical protein CI109_004274 [Kwoniella shandongensis]
MSTTAVRMNSSHAPSPSYVPRTLSRPSSPALPPHPAHHRSSSTSRIDIRPLSPGLGMAPTPKMGLERSSSGLRNEVKSQRPGVSDGARAILKILASLPAPLPETLPPTFLPTPSASPEPAVSATSPPKTFSEFVHSSSSSHSKRKRSSSRSSSDSESSSPSNDSTGLPGIGLGLGLTMTSESSKKGQKIDDNLARSVSASGDKRSLTPAMGSGSPMMGLVRKESMRGKSGLRNEVVDEREEGKETWSREQWKAAAEVYRNRALLLKRHGDAYQRTKTAHAQYVSALPHDPLKGLLCLTDAVLLWLYAYFCEEQGGGRVRSTPYNESAPLRDFVRRLWEVEMRKGEDEGRREMARAMVGLMHLIEAVVCYHLTAEQLKHLSRRGTELASSTPSSMHGPSPSSTTSASPPGGHHHTSNNTNPPHPSPAARSHSSSSSHHSPDSQTSYSLPPDLLPLISTSTTSSSRASQSLLTSRHHLSLRLLRTQFPKTFEYALSSELNDEALPAPGDILGSARKVDVDRPEKFAWPIELGMCAPVAHTVAFGRCLVEELAEKEGKEWERKLE